MANNAPFNQLAGIRLAIYLGPASEPPPAVNAAPAGNWLRFGVTDGGQKFKHLGDLEYRSDDDHVVDVLAFRTTDGIEVTATLVDLTLEQWARYLNNVSKVVAAGGPPAIKTMPLAKGAFPTRYAMLLTGAILSPYGAFPGFGYIPIGVFGGEPEVGFTKDDRAGVEFTFHALADDTQSADNVVGYVRVQTA